MGDGDGTQETGTPSMSAASFLTAPRRCSFSSWLGFVLRFIPRHTGRKSRGPCALCDASQSDVRRRRLLGTMLRQRLNNPTPYVLFLLNLYIRSSITFQANSLACLRHLRRGSYVISAPLQCRLAPLCSATIKDTNVTGVSLTRLARDATPFAYVCTRKRY